MNTYQVICLVGFSLCFVSFTWAIQQFFTSNGKQKGMQAIKYFGALFSVAHFLTLIFAYAPWPPLIPIAILLYVLSLLIFWWAINVNQTQPLSLAYSLDKPTHLVKTGPYNWVRHPFYTSYLCFWMAGTVASGQWLLLFSVVVMFYLYFTAAKFEEHKFISSDLKEQYQTYQNQTGMFLPFKGRYHNN